MDLEKMDEILCINIKVYEILLARPNRSINHIICRFITIVGYVNASKILIVEWCL